MIKSVLISSLFSSFSLFAAQDMPSFAKIDKNNDGFISKKESAELKVFIDSFLAVDIDGDGQISLNEFRRHVALNKNAKGMEK